MEERERDAEARVWRGRVAVVTGAASGIGLAIAERCAAAGMVLVLVDRADDRLARAGEDVRARGAAAVHRFTADVSHAGEVEALAGRIAEEIGDVHVLCNNAGVIRPGRSWECSPADWDAVLGVNLLGVANGIRAFVPGMLAHGEDSHVVNTASVAGLFPAPSYAAYCVSKAAVVALTEALAAEVAAIPGARLRVSALCPGGVATALYRDEVARREDAGLEGPTADAWARHAAPDRTDQLDADEVAGAVWQALQDGSFWILPMQAELRVAASDRLGRLAAALGSPADGGASSVLARYYERVDGPAPSSALDLVDEGLEFCLVRPERRIEGTSSRDLAGYLASRAPLAHRLHRTARDGDIEFVLGESVDGERSLGTFLASARTTPDGRIDRYLAAFYPGRTP